MDNCQAHSKHNSLNAYNGINVNWVLSKRIYASLQLNPLLLTSHVHHSRIYCGYFKYFTLDMIPSKNCPK